MNRLKALRSSREWTQQDLAERLNTTRQSVARYESGDRNMEIPIILKLCEIFGCSSDYLLGRSDLPDPHLTADESDLIRSYRALSETGREFIRHSVALASLGHSAVDGAFSDVEGAEVNGGGEQ